MFRILLLTAHDPNDLAHGMGLVVGNTIRELSYFPGVEVKLGLLLANDRHPCVTAPSGPELNLNSAVICETRVFHPRRERFRSLFNRPVAPDCARFLSLVQRESAQADVVVWFGYFWDSVSYWLPRFSSAPAVFHPNDSLSLSETSKTSQSSIWRTIRAFWAASQERKILKSGYRGIVYCSKADAAHAQILLGERESPSIVGLENGVNAARFSPGPQPTEKPSGRPVCLFTGRLDHPPNIEAVIAMVHVILPKLPPNVQLWVAGANPVQRIRDCCRRSPDRVRLLPDVADIVALYRSADVFLAPMTGKAGIKNKILEAAACGVAIVTTADGASGLGTVLPGIIVSRDIADMANGVTALLARDCATQHVDSLALREFVSQRFNWTGRSRSLLSFLARNCPQLAPRGVN